MRRFGVLIVIAMAFMTYSYFGNDLILFPRISGKLFNSEGEVVEVRLVQTYTHKGKQKIKMMESDMRGEFMFHPVKTRSFLFGLVPGDKVSNVVIKGNHNGKEMILYKHNATHNSSGEEIDQDSNINLNCNLDHINPENDKYFGLCKPQ